MRTPISLLAIAGAIALAGPAMAKGGDQPSADEAPNDPPRLVVAIAVDQFSADLFAQYRRHFTAGLARLQEGAVFPSAYQSHATTETCPGHSTILTGARPSRSGIVANYWFDPGIARGEKRIYCAEAPSNPASSPSNPVVSARFLRVPTLGDRMKARNPASRNVAVSAKDRAVVMMGGRTIDAGYWWKGGGFTTFAGKELSQAAKTENAAATSAIRAGASAMDVPSWCTPRDLAVHLGDFAIGTSRFRMQPDEPRQFAASPRIDAATASLALRLVDEMELGKGAAVDMLSVSFSATDTIGHAYGHQGVEMCIQLAELDRTIGRLLAQLDKRRIEYAVVLTADHGGIDAPERLDTQAYPRATRVSAGLSVAELSAAVTARTGIALPAGPMLYADSAGGDIYVSDSLRSQDKAKVSAALVTLLKAHPQVAAVFTAQELAETPLPSGSPQDWSLRDRVRASFDADRSGDVIALLDRAVAPFPARPGIVATHGSAWDYDRRVPILFWRRGLPGFEQPAPVETVDIAPSLAALIGLRVPEGSFDGRCLDLHGGEINTCGDR